MHGAENVLFSPDQANIDWITGNTLGGVRYHCSARQRFLMLVMRPAQLEDDVSLGFRNSRKR